MYPNVRPCGHFLLAPVQSARAVSQVSIRARTDFFSKRPSSPHVLAARIERQVEPSAPAPAFRPDAHSARAGSQSASKVRCSQVLARAFSHVGSVPVSDVTWIQVFARALQTPIRPTQRTTHIWTWSSSPYGWSSPRRLAAQTVRQSSALSVMVPDAFALGLRVQRKRARAFDAQRNCQNLPGRVRAVTA